MQYLIQGCEVQDVLYIGLAMEGHERTDLQFIVCIARSGRSDMRKAAFVHHCYTEHW